MQTPCWTFSITLNQTFSLILAWTPWFSPWSLCTFSPFVCWFFSNYAIVYHSYIKGWWDTTSWPYVWMWVWMVVYLKNWPGCHQSTRSLSPVDGGDRLQLLLRLTSAFLSPLAALTMLCCVFVCFFLSTGAYTNLPDEFCQDKDRRKPRLRCRKVQGAQDEAELRTWKRP